MKNSENIVNKVLASKLRIGVVVASVLLLTVLTVLSMQRALPWITASAESEASVNGPKQKPLVTLNERGETVVLDRQTGQSRRLSQDESRRLAEGLKQIINDSSAGLVEVAKEDGTVSIDLKGHFHNAMVVRKEEDGTLTHSCINDLRTAAAFFEIDPKLLDIDGPVPSFRPTSSQSQTDR